MTTATHPVLHDPGHRVPEPAAGKWPPGTLGWLRAQVARFANGPVHARRRALAEEALGALPPPDALRRDARRRARSLDPARVPVAVLGARLGVAQAELDALTTAVAVVAPHYLTGLREGTEAAGVDAAVDRLRLLLGPGDDERVAARIGLLMQASEATAALIRHALRQPAGTAEQRVARALETDPPVRTTRRLAPDGTLVTVDLATAGLPFGGGHRPCPGQAQALALACGVLDAAQPEADR
jgi:hypothetical protein